MTKSAANTGLTATVARRLVRLIEPVEEIDAHGDFLFDAKEGGLP